MRLRSRTDGIKKVFGENASVKLPNFDSSVIGTTSATASFSAIKKKNLSLKWARAALESYGQALNTIPWAYYLRIGMMQLAN